MQVKVWNDNKYPFKQRYQDRDINIAPGKFVMMEHDDAHQFLCMFHPIKMNADGRPDEQTRKALRIDTGHNPLPPAKAPEHICHCCGYKAPSATSLDAHVKELHIEQLADDEERDNQREQKIASKRKPKAPEGNDVQSGVSAT